MFTIFTQSKIAAIALTSTLVFASTAQAENVTLEKYVTGMVNQAMIAAQQEIKHNVRTAVLTVVNNVSLSEEKSYTANVSITDIETENRNENITADKTQAE